MEEIKKNEIIQEIRKMGENINKRMDGMQDQINGLSNRMDGFTDRMDELSNRMDGMQEQEDNQNSRIARIEEKIDNINRTVILIENRYETKTDILCEVFPEYAERIKKNENKIKKHDLDIDVIKSIIKDQYEEKVKKTV